MSFPWIWVTAWTAVALPLAVLLFLGRAPGRLHRRVGPRGLRARGALILAAYAGALVQGRRTWPGSPGPTGTSCGC
ncbi:hypothetical protein [Streptomyces sp. NPDC002133]|uniref:hypothetical protein n=1 Tax=Streptomyces sp. NPDC002133 TaxID=3154409 RepID=UPI00332DA39E